MPGEPFFPENPDRCGILRLNFSHAMESDIDRGLATLARLLR
jgi:DNA-binding transcriptional MocR family regulator